ncbi:MAG: hypothetical protein V1729_02305 [Candidatus Woesearchaeota archaeon]
MMAQNFNPDPSDLSSSTIQQLFYRQIRSLTSKTSDASLNDKLRTFDMQFSDAWF